MMKTLKTHFSKNTAFWCWGYAAILYLLARSTFLLYSDVDNYELAMLMNGQFGQLGCLFLSPVICAIVYALSFVFRAGDSFSILLFVFSFLALGLMLRSVAASALCCREKILWTAVLSAMWFWARILGTNFTVNSIFFFEAGMILEYFGKKERSKAKYLWAVLYFLLGAMIRPKVGIMVIPYWLLHNGTDFIFSPRVKKEVSFKQLFLQMIPIVCIGAILLIGKVYTSFPSVQSADAYNTLRSYAVDYPVYAYSEITAPEFGISEADYNAVLNWIFLHSPGRMKEIFGQIIQFGSCKLVTSDAAGLHALMLSLYWDILELRSKLIFPLCVLLSLFIYGLLIRIPWYRLAEMVCAWLGSAVILIYYTYQGRAPLRIWLAVLMLCMTVCLLALRSDTEPAEEEKESRLPLWAAVLSSVCIAAIAVGVLSENSKILLLAFLLTAMVLAVLTAVRQNCGQQLLISGAVVCVSAVTIVTMITANGLRIPQSPFTARIGNEFEATQAMCSEDALYFHISPYSVFQEQGKLPGKKYVAHNLSLGGWNYGQPYFNTILESYGTDNSAQALMEREHTYLVAPEYQMEIALAVLRQDYGQAVQAIPCGSFNGTTIWKFNIE